MAETLVSPGVLARENDQSFVSQQPVNVGAAIIGPTVKGPVEVPTVVTSYSDFKNKFGAVLTSGSDEYTYFTSIAAYNYFNNGGESLLVARTVSGSYTAASSSAITNNESVTGGVEATGSEQLAAAFTDGIEARITYDSTVYRFVASGDPIPQDDVDGNLYFFSTGSTPTATATNLAAEINAALSGSAASASVDLLVASTSTDTLIISASAVGTAYNGITVSTGSAADFSTLITLGGGVDGTGNTEAFVLETISEGVIMNSTSTEDSNGALASGSSDNVRWEIQNADTSSGTFTLLVRQGNDITNDKSVLETWTNLSLDPKASNFISKVIGDQSLSYNSSDNQVAVSGQYPNSSRYVRVSSVNSLTPDYFDNNGVAKSAYTASIPNNGSGSFGAATGDVAAGANFYDNIGTQTQGLNASDYDDMISLLSNKDDYQYNVLLTPGLTDSDHTSQITSMITNTQERGDALLIVDPRLYGASVANAVTTAGTRNTSYAASYWPWVQVVDPDRGAMVWVPASTVMGGVFAYNDSVSEPWFAPAGINRGGLSQVVRAEKKLTQANRDTLYAGKVNPIATFPGTGVVVYGQKTLQTRASALDRVNVRRLLIQLKSYISQVADNLVFEQNTIATRNQFLSQVNPYLESVQQRQGLYAFKVVMDDTNNTADVIDRNQLVGQIYIQPTKTAEFIYLDFNVLPTGATFPA